MAHLFIYSEVKIYPARRGLVCVLQALCIAKQYRRRKLIVKEAALYEAGFGNGRARVKAYIVPNAYAKLLNIVLAFNYFVNKHFNRVKGALCVAVFLVYVNACVNKLANAGVAPAVAGENGAVLSLHIVCVKAAYVGYPQRAAALYFRNHAAQRIHMRAKQNGVPFAAQAYAHAALCGHIRLVAQRFKFIHYVIRSLAREARGAGDGEQIFKLLLDIFHCKQYLRMYFCSIIQ